MKKLLTLFALTLVAFTTNAQSTLNGDMNYDGEKNITDVMLLVDEILNGTKPQAYLSCPDGNHPHLIDLGLPSGTKWACCNVGAAMPDDYGGYYAWGETVEKSIYAPETYQYAYEDANGSYYINGKKYTVINLGSDIAGTQYDVAHVKWGGKWQIPSLDQINELLNNCSYAWTSMNGVNGGKFTGSSGGTIFLPAAGYRKEDLQADGRYGLYTSSTQHPSYPFWAYGFDLDSDIARWTIGGRDNSASVRPVWVP